MRTSDMRSDLLSLRPLHITEPLAVIVTDDCDIKSYDRKTEILFKGKHKY